MGKLFLIVSVLFISVQAFPNAGIFQGVGSNIRMEKSNDIQMVSEEVLMFLERAAYPVTGGVMGIDKMRYHCTFNLKNLSDKEVTVQVGFPLSSGTNFSRRDSNQIEMASQYAFLAGTEKELYQVRYVPYDKKNKFSHIFLWDMNFAPNEEKKLVVTYTMGGYTGLGSTQKPPYNWQKEYKLPYLRDLAGCIAQEYGYVTETGNSWAGEIEKATFKLYLFEFEEYLQKRGALEETEKSRMLKKRREEEKKKRDEESFKKFGKKEIASPKLEFSNTFRRTLGPASGWTEAGSEKERKYMTLEYSPFKPGVELKVMYYFAMMPDTAEQFENIITRIKGPINNAYARAQKIKKEKPEEYEKRKSHFERCEPYSDSAERNIACMILEFYGYKTGNQDIKDFIEDQIWYPVKEEQKIDPALKARLDAAAKLK